MCQTAGFRTAPGCSLPTPRRVIFPSRSASGGIARLLRRASSFQTKHWQHPDGILTCRARPHAERLAARACVGKQLPDRP
eukprot:1262697-Rhodomonas_salina.1